MRKLFFLLILSPYFVFSQGTLIFSEYGEGSSFNKWVEIYNPTSQDILLDPYVYSFCWNGCDNLDWEFQIPFDSGYVLMSGETYLLVHYDADSILLDAANQTTNLLSNGNDVIGLFDTSIDEIIDIIGVFDSLDVGDGWDVDGVTNATQNHTMIRQADVCSGNGGSWSLSDGSVASSEWIVGGIDDYSNINAHVSNCMGTHTFDLSKSSSRYLIEVRDLLGRKTTSLNQPVFFIYDDGTVDKRMIIR